MRSRWLVLVVAGLLLLAAACVPAPTNVTNTTGVPTSAPTTPTAPTTTTAEVFRATLSSVNRSGVTGEATVTVQGSNLIVQITASGLVPDQEHAQHIHGFPGSRTSTCPPPAAEGTVTQEPDAEKTGYGPVLVPLTPFPTADASGNMTYTATVSAASVVPTISVPPLAGREIVLHGLMVGGTYEKGVPVACGTLVAVPGAAPSTTPTSGAPSNVPTSGGGSSGSSGGLGY